MLINSRRNWLNSLVSSLNGRNIRRLKPISRPRRRSRRGRLDSKAAEVLEDRALLATITVTGLGDNVMDADGQVTLREAIQAANTDMSVDGSTAGSGPDTIVFDASLTSSGPATILLGGTELDVTDSLTITGPGADRLIIDGGAQNARLLDITGGDFTVSGVTLTRGGGTSFSGFGAGILFRSSGALTVTASAITETETTGGGGAIRLDSGSSPALIHRSTLSGNTAAAGGGISTESDLTLTSSTISDNTATAGDGGGVQINNGNLTITSSTITDNHVTGTGGGRFGGGVSTTGNTTGLTVNSSIIAGNTNVGAAGAGADLFNGFGPTANVTFTLIGDGSGSTVPAAPVGSPDINGNLVGTNAVPIDAMLGSLQDNGGPTLTHELLTGSPALNAGDSTISDSNDQRQFPFLRDDGNGVDMGAFESQSLSITVDTLGDIVDGDFSPGEVSLREAIGAANSNPGADSIAFDPTLVSGGFTDIFLDGNELSIDDDLSITGLGADTFAVNATGSSRVFHIQPGVDATISRLLITEGNGFLGGGVLNEGSLTLDTVGLFANTASEGGAVFHDATAASLTVINSEIVNNGANNSGGGLFLNGSSAVLINSTITGNTAGVNGGAIWGLQSNPFFSGLTIINNRADADGNGSGIGGGYGAFQAPATMIDNLIAGNYLGTGTVPDDITSGGGAIVESGSTNNLIGDASTAGGLMDGVDDNIVGVDWMTVVENDGTDPILGANGGTTRTIALLENSPALNGGAVLPSQASDQRGLPFMRDDGNGVDIGAFELQSLSLIVDIGGDENDGNFTPGNLSLREAVDQANANPRADSISFDPVLVANFGAFIQLNGSELLLEDDVTVSGPGAGTAGVNAGGTSRVFHVAPGVDATISGLEVNGGNATNGGAILNEGSLTVDSLAIYSSSAQDGGGIYHDASATGLIVLNTELSSNTASGSGGGLFLFGPNADIRNSTIAFNSADVFGGGIWGLTTTNRFTNLTIVNNRADADDNGSGVGGGYSAFQGPAVMINNLIAGNFRGAGTTPDDITADFGTIVVPGQSTNNLIGDAASSGGLTDMTDGNIVGVDWMTVVENNGIGSILGPNGGSSWNVRLLPGSPAIDAGTDLLPFTGISDFDQRGTPFSRIAGNGIDIGAHEAHFDFGDAPVPYPTLTADNGAVHSIEGPRLGTLVDPESDGQPDASALGDDTTDEADEDGVRFLSGTQLFAGAFTGIEFDLQNPNSAINLVDVWIDFNADGDWDDAGEHIVDSVSLGIVAGPQTLTVQIPDTINTGMSGINNPTMARVRLNTFSDLGPTGFASDGEVEDYLVTLNDPSQFGLDYGDAPSPYPTLLADNGARHVAIGPSLGFRDGNSDGIPHAFALGDDRTGTRDDENGVSLVTNMVQGSTATIEVLVDENNVSATDTGFLNGWIDFNQDGDWDDFGEQVVVNQLLDAGSTQLSFDIPGGATTGATFGRFRITSFEDVPVDGLASDGEVEDYAFTILESAAAPASVNLPGAGGDYEVLIDGTDLVVQISGGAEQFRQSVVSVSQLAITGDANADNVTVLESGGVVTTAISFVGNGGNDSFDGELAAGPLTLNGNGGDDVLIGGTGVDLLNGGSNKDELIGGPGSDVLNGGSSTGDTLEGGDGDDTLNGGGGNDLIRESFEHDAVLTNSAMTGRGNDVVIFAERARLFGSLFAGLSIDASAFFTPGLTSVTISGGAAEDEIFGSPGNDILRGGGGNDLIRAGDGNDRAFGGAGADTLEGEGGNDLLKGLGGSGDRINGGAGDDLINGGRGIDRLVETADADLTLTTTTMTGAGTDIVQAIEIGELNGGASANVLDVSGFNGGPKGFTVLRGNGGDDFLIGSPFPDILNGGEGDDTLQGKESADTLNGDGGADALSGHEGNDLINGGDFHDIAYGGNGDDTLNGDRGVDRLIGGAGDDNLAGGNGTDTLVGGTGADDASAGDVFNDATAIIDEFFVINPLPGWVDQV